ncbi:sterol desaturase family protein [Bradyrhizobium sp. Pa8]|uniref:sterol desaturase family protein n=1 Tax=Bradyrhizobium sp. Pa8 TaxID=3386552 RepID=UPI00403FB7D3
MIPALRGALALALRGGAFPKPNWLYWLDFAAYPLLALALAAIDWRDASWPAWAAAGFVLFTFTEYWVHRLPLHAWLYHARHERHHTHPREYVVFPIYYTPAVFALAFFVMPRAIFAGFVVGYVWFLVWHHLLHHADMNSLPAPIRRYALWHLAHHHDERCNFGITVPLWDFVFGTYRRV